MENDLSTVADEALDALEAQDQAEDEAETPEEAPAENAEAQPEAEEQEVESGQPEESEAPEKPEEEEEKPEKKEMTDEEFEELARRRGYSKEQPQTPQSSLLERPEEVSEEVWANTPAENKILYNALPYIEAVGADGETLKVKTPDQLPDDWEFKNKKEEMKFNNDMVAQERKAEALGEALEQKRMAYESHEQKLAVARQVVGEVEGLQKTGALPTPKAKPGTDEFDADPAVQTINKVISVWKDRASKGSAISMKDALAIYRYEHPDEFAKAQNRADAERKAIARRVSGNTKSASTAVNKNEDSRPRYYKNGMSIEDVLDLALEDMD